MKKINLFLILILSTFFVSAQKYIDDRRAFFYVEVRDADSIEITHPVAMAFGNMRYFNGTLIESIHFLLGCTPARTKVIGTVPRRFIHCSTQAPCNIDELLMKSLMNYYGFEIRDTQQKQEVWFLRPKDTTKLSRHEYDMRVKGYGIYGPNDITKSWGGTGVLLDAFCRNLEIYSNRFVINQVPYSTYYEFKPILFKDMADYNVMHQLLLEEYGWELISEMRIENIKQIVFDPKKGIKNFQFNFELKTD